MAILQLISTVSGWWVKRAGRDGPRFQAIDTDPAMAEQFGPGEFYYLGGAPLREMLLQMRNSPKAFSSLASRLGDLDKLNRAAGTDVVYQGSQRCRPIALISLVFHLERGGGRVYWTS